MGAWLDAGDSIDGKETIAKLSSNEGALGPSPKAMAAYAKAASELHRYPDGDTAKLRKVPEQRVAAAFLATLPASTGGR